MDLLKLEYQRADEGSYLYNIGQLIKRVKHYRNNLPIDEFEAAIPELKKLERELQDFDLSISGEMRNYIQEIMDELKEEDEIENNFLEEVIRVAKPIIAYHSCISLFRF